MTPDGGVSPALEGVVTAMDAPTHRPVILIVDDDPLNVRVLHEILKGDYEICAATSGLDALAFCHAQPPDLVLLDMTMPGMDGHELCRRLVNDQATRDIPIIFVTARNSSQAEAQALSEGAADFISKPVDERVVRARVRNQLKLKLLGDKLRSLAMIDGLTGIANRRRFDEALNDACRRATRDFTRLSLLLLDVDRFKDFNDRYGHPAGDRCLRTIASTIAALARRPGDLVARYGGEEMAIILPRAKADFAKSTAGALVAAVEALAIPHAGNTDCGGVVTVSVGVATFGPLEQPLSADKLIAAADNRLYEAKSAGRNRVMPAVYAGEQSEPGAGRPDFLKAPAPGRPGSRRWDAWR